MSDTKTKSKPLFVEFHALRSYPPSNLNRDDMGSPKRITFGGVPRVRVSSQCLKRTWRMSEFFRGQLADEQLGVRTQRVPHDVFEKLGPAYDDKARQGLAAIFAALGKKGDTKGASGAEPEEGDASSEEADAAASTAVDAEKTDHLLFVSQQEIEQIAAFARQRADDLAAALKTQRKKLVADPKAIEKLRKALKEHLEKTCERNAVDVALFGRFLTSDEFGECNAALQVAHALGTQKLDLEYDYFTAVDDRQPSGDAGAGHLGETELCASVLYEYAVCDFPLLTKNLGGDRPLAARAMKAIALAMCRSIFEKAKRNGTAPHTPADYLEIVVRTDAPVSLANAFLKPVRPRGVDADVMDVAIEQLRTQGDTYAAAYGGVDAKDRFVFDLRDGARATHKTLRDLGDAIEKHLIAREDRA